jgi:superfamily II DNA or RNA helicase
VYNKRKYARKDVCLPMKVTETQVVVSLVSPYDSQYLELLNEYFIASERNSRDSSIQEKKNLMAIKEKMVVLCNRNPEKLDHLKSIVSRVRDKREKAVVITKSNLVAADLAEMLTEVFGGRSVLQITNHNSVHEAIQILGQFDKLPESTVLILSDLVNTGLDLTAANHLIHYDYPLKYTDMIQRNNRITRQTSHHREVEVYYLTTSGKIDEFEYLECRKT